MLLEAIDLGKRFGNETILDAVSLSLARGQSLSVTGPSGSGKSTLLSLLGLLLQPSCGEVRFMGQLVSELSDEERSRLRNRSFGFIFQNPQLIGSLSVLDNVLVPARLARRRGMEKAATTLLCQLGLEHRLKHLPHQLSIGQKRRVAMARALLLEPALLFADEPTNDLDEKLAAEVGDYLLGLPGDGCALVVVTHDLSLARKADRRVQLAQSRLRELPEAPRLVTEIDHSNQTLRRHL